MNLPQIPHDDLIDVMEMTNKIEDYLLHVLKDNDRNLALSALMNASINYMFGLCKTLDEVVFYRNLFMQILDNFIRSLHINGKD